MLAKQAVQRPCLVPRQCNGSVLCKNVVDEESGCVRTVIGRDRKVRTAVPSLGLRAELAASVDSRFDVGVLVRRRDSKNAVALAHVFFLAPTLAGMDRKVTPQHKMYKLSQCDRMLAYGLNETVPETADTIHPLLSDQRPTVPPCDTKSFVPREDDIDVKAFATDPVPGIEIVPVSIHG